MTTPGDTPSNGHRDYQWTPIEDLPADTSGLRDVELEALASVWKQQRGRLEGTGGFKRFLDRLKRQWAIETGVIEQVYRIDRGITELLIEQGLDASLVPHGTTMRPWTGSSTSWRAGGP